MWTYVNKSYMCRGTYKGVDCHWRACESYPHLYNIIAKSAQTYTHISSPDNREHRIHLARNERKVEVSTES